MIDDRAEPWERVTLTLTEFEAEAKADLALKEAEAVARLREMFAAHRARLASDLLRLGRDLAIQRGEVH